MRVLVLGIDGYIGFPLSMHLANNGCQVVGVDNFLRRKCVSEVGSYSAIPIGSISERLAAFKQTFRKKIDFEYGDLRNYNFVDRVIRECEPEAIVHLGELPSAPYSMIDVKHAALTQVNNLVGTLNILYAMRKHVPCSQLIKMGSMGEYGTPKIDIPEGPFEIEYKGRKDVMPFPKRALTDWYHWSKVYDSGNIELACQIWDLRSTDIMQGVVYGIKTNEMVNGDLVTRFDFDAVFGTVINRFCAQAVLGHKLTPYGLGEQKRPFISLRDAIQCLTLAIKNPPDRGAYRVCNIYDEVYSVTQIAEKVKSTATRLGLEAEIEHYENPRVEQEQVGYYNPVHEKMYQLGYKPSHNIEAELELMLTDLIKYKKRLMIGEKQILPKVRWESTDNKPEYSVESSVGVEVSVH